jgi:hypothetical protein
VRDDVGDERERESTGERERTGERARERERGETKSCFLPLVLLESKCMGGPSFLTTLSY